jgi:hypothetical protein
MGFDPEKPRYTAEVTVDEPQKGGELRRLYVRASTQEGDLVSVTIEAAPGTFLSWADVEKTLPKEARKLAKGGKS